MVVGGAVVPVVAAGGVVAVVPGVVPGSGVVDDGVPVVESDAVGLLALGVIALGAPEVSVVVTPAIVSGLASDDCEPHAVRSAANETRASDARSVFAATAHS